MPIFVFESYDQYDGQLGVAVVAAESEEKARELMGRASHVHNWSIANFYWALEATIPSSVTEENIFYSVYL